MELKIEADTFTISGQNTPQELEQALSQLCELHAQVTGARDANGNPAFALGRCAFDTKLGQDGTFRIGFLGRPFGMLIVDLTAPATALLVKKAAENLELALATAQAASERFDAGGAAVLQ